MDIIDSIGFYLSAFWLKIIQFIPMLIIGLVFAIIICLVVLITRKIVDRQWTQEPEKLQKAAKVKLRCYEIEIEKLQKLLDQTLKTNDKLVVVIQAGREHAQQVINILTKGGEE